MKILMITKYYEPHVGGVEKHIKQISTELIKRGHRVTMLTTQYDSKIQSAETIDGIRINRFRTRDKRFIGLLSIWSKIIINYRFLNRFDIIHVHDVYIWMLPYKLLFPSKKIYLTNHGWEGLYPIPFKNKLIKQLGTKLSSGTITVGEYLDKYYGIKSDIFIYGAIDSSKYKIEKKQKLAIYLGRLEQDTGLPKVLPVIKNLSEQGYKIKFIGEGILKKECAKYGETLGIIDNPMTYLRKSKICFAGGYLSTIESLLNKNIVIISYDNQLKKDCFNLTPFRRWIICSNNEKIILKKLKFILDNKKYYTELTNEAHDWANKQTWNKIANKYLTLWRI